MKEVWLVFAGVKGEEGGNLVWESRSEVFMGVGGVVMTMGLLVSQSIVDNQPTMCQ